MSTHRRRPGGMKRSEYHRDTGILGCASMKCISMAASKAMSSTWQRESRAIRPCIDSACMTIFISAIRKAALLRIYHVETPKRPIMLPIAPSMAGKSTSIGDTQKRGEHSMPGLEALFYSSLPFAEAASNCAKAKFQGSASLCGMLKTIAARRRRLPVVFRSPDRASRGKSSRRVDIDFLLRKRLCSSLGAGLSGVTESGIVAQIVTANEILKCKKRRTSRRP